MELFVTTYEKETKGTGDFLGIITPETRGVLGSFSLKIASKDSASLLQVAWSQNKTRLKELLIREAIETGLDACNIHIIECGATVTTLFKVPERTAPPLDKVCEFLKTVSSSSHIISNQFLRTVSIPRPFFKPCPAAQKNSEPENLPAEKSNKSQSPSI